MKKATVAVLGSLPLLLAACSTDGGESTPTSTSSSAASAESAPTTTSETPEMKDPGEVADGAQVGSEAGFDCKAFGDCSVLFTVEAIEVLDSCPGLAYAEQPADTQLVRIPVLIKTKPSDFDYDPSTFAVWSDWSALTADGINHPLANSSWCTTPQGETQWPTETHVGDTVRHVHYTDMPAGAQEIRLTETRVGSRWVYSGDQIQGR